ncbi:hypothetical protein GALMADRAFT_932830 [Galerina marginata CBS 339.88]|uniref:Uncharacterized protein n=1 Tax=Galerina marginata (strain CBS 339.88) TaxID=685588 RepID=A0A067SDM2_GALM3|nr:hypothetical protein GALMADRAFT_932830 [Galerina marginata CBS 339.88]
MAESSISTARLISGTSFCAGSRQGYFAGAALAKFNGDGEEDRRRRSANVSGAKGKKRRDLSLLMDDSDLHSNHANLDTYLLPPPTHSFTSGLDPDSSGGITSTPP